MNILWKPLQEIFAPPQDILAVFLRISESLEAASRDLCTSPGYPRSLFLVVLRISVNRFRRSLHLLKISSESSTIPSFSKSLEIALGDLCISSGYPQNRFIVVLRISGNRFRRSLHLLRVSVESSNLSSFSRFLETASGDPCTSSGYPWNLPVYNRFQNLWKPL